MGCSHPLFFSLYGQDAHELRGQWSSLSRSGNIDVLRDDAEVGDRVAIIGAGVGALAGRAIDRNC